MHATGFPPKVEKYPPSLSETSLLHTTAPMGKPLPRGLPTVTTSGAGPKSWKPHMLLPALPSPD